MDQVRDLHQELKEYVDRQARGKIDEYFAEHFNQKFPDFTPGMRYTATRQIVEAHAVMVPPLTKQMASAIHYSMVEMWGPGNLWSRKMEQDVMHLLGLQYSGGSCNEKKKQRNFNGGWISQVFVDRKNAMFDQVRRNGRIRFREYPCSRKSKGTQDFKKDKPKPLMMAARNKEVHGYNGWVKICEGHPEAPSLVGAVTATEVQQQAATAALPALTVSPAAVNLPVVTPHAATAALPALTVSPAAVNLPVVTPHQDGSLAQVAALLANIGLSLEDVHKMAQDQNPSVPAGETPTAGLTFFDSDIAGKKDDYWEHSMHDESDDEEDIFDSFNSYPMLDSSGPVNQSTEHMDSGVSNY